MVGKPTASDARNEDHLEHTCGILPLTTSVMCYSATVWSLSNFLPRVLKAPGSWGFRFKLTKRSADLNKYVSTLGLVMLD